MLTFTRRAALEMTRRAQQILVASQRGRAAGGAEAALLPWSGTFYSIANPLLRRHAATLSLDPAFTVLDRADSADLMDLVAAISASPAPAPGSQRRARVWRSIPTASMRAVRLRRRWPTPSPGATSGKPS